MLLGVPKMKPIGLVATPKLLETANFRTPWVLMGTPLADQTFPNTSPEAAGLVVHCTPGGTGSESAARLQVAPTRFDPVRMTGPNGALRLIDAGGPLGGPAKTVGVKFEGLLVFPVPCWSLRLTGR